MRRPDVVLLHTCVLSQCVLTRSDSSSSFKIEIESLSSPISSIFERSRRICSARSRRELSRDTSSCHCSSESARCNSMTCSAVAALLFSCSSNNIPCCLCISLFHRVRSSSSSPPLPSLSSRISSSQPCNSFFRSARNCESMSQWQQCRVQPVFPRVVTC